MTKRKKQSTEAAVREIRLYYRWSKDFLEAGKKQLAGDTVREATSDEVKDLRSENRELREVVAEITLKNRVLKKSLTGHGEEDAT
jgi:transposase